MRSVLGIGINTLDYTIATKGFPIEDSKSLGYDKCDFQAGGPIPNVLVCLSRLGFSAKYVGNTSKDNDGDLIVYGLKKEGVDVSGVYRTAIEANKSFIISNSENNTRTVLWKRIPKTDYINKSQIPYDAIKDSDIVLIDGLEKECSKDTIKFAKKNNKKVIYGAESTSQADFLLPYVDVIVSPKESIKKYTGFGNVKNIMKFLKKYPLKQAFITDGQNGSYAIDFLNENILYQPSFDIDIVDSTGAGDAYLAGITFSIINNKDIKDSLIIASAIAGLNCLSLGGRSGLPTKKQLREFMIKSNLEDILK